MTQGESLPNPGAEPDPHRPALAALFLIAGVVLAVDLWTKRWATETLAGQPSQPVIGELVRFTYTRNSGVAFGLGAGLPFPYWLFSIVAALAIVWLFVRQRVPSPARRIALALILGGALGNLVDRVRFGEVVDFIEVGWGRWHWPVFNVADSAVSIGVVLFALAWPRHKSESAPPAGETGGPPGPEADAGAGSAGPAQRAVLSPGIHDHDAGAGPVRAAAAHGGASGPLPGRGADGPVA